MTHASRIRRFLTAAVVVLTTAPASVAIQSPPSAAGSPPAAARGPYFGQPAPGLTPELFAPEVVTAMQMTRTPVFTSDGREVFWSTSLGQNKSQLMTARLSSDGWLAAEALPFSSGEYFDHNPAPSFDGHRVVFASNRPIAGKSATTMPGTTVSTSDLWMTERTASGWSAPVALGPEINTPADDDVPALTRDGTLYYGSSRPGAPGPAAIYRSRFVGGRFEAPELVPAPVTTTAGEMFNDVAPDESLLIFLAFRQGVAGGLHVSFKQANGGWGEPVKLGDPIANLRAYFLTMSPDGRRLFFTSTLKGGGPQIYCVDANVIRDLNPQTEPAPTARGRLSELRGPYLGQPVPGLTPTRRSHDAHRLPGDPAAASCRPCQPRPADRTRNIAQRPPPPGLHGTPAGSCPSSACTRRAIEPTTGTSVAPRDSGYLGFVEMSFGIRTLSLTIKTAEAAEGRPG